MKEAQEIPENLIVLLAVATKTPRTPVDELYRRA
jgi:hypothetical protein